MGFMERQLPAPDYASLNKGWQNDPKILGVWITGGLVLFELSYGIMTRAGGKKMIDFNKSRYGGFLGVSLIAVYGVFARLIFGFQGVSDVLGGVVTLGFLFLIPVTLGGLTVAVLPQRYKTSWPHAIFLPWLTCLIVIGVIAIFALEAVVCLVLGLPIFLPMSSLGGLIAWLIARERAKDKVQLTLVIFLLAPYFVATLESRFPNPTSIRTVETRIVINAPGDVVWDQITSVPTIQPEEHHPAAFHLLGVPKPVRAMLPRGAVVGAMRRSTYEGELHFIEAVTVWQPDQGFSFTIDLVSPQTAPWPWNQIGGPYFELLDGAYRIEPLDDKRVVLHLSSRHRLSTKFNVYGGFWTDFILGDIQNYILTVVKGRAEAQPR